MSSKPNKDLVTLLSLHLEWLKIHNYTEATITSKRNYLRRFIAWCQDRSITQADEVSRQVIEQFQRWIYYYRTAKNQPLSWQSQKSWLIILRRWFEWMCRQRHLTYNPAATIRLPVVKKTLPLNALTVEEVERVMSVVDVSTPLGLRNRAMLELLYSSGLRRMELTYLKVYDLDLEQGLLKVRQGKGKKDRVVPVGDRAVVWITCYLKDVRPGLVKGNDHGELFLSLKYGVPFNPARMARRYLTAAGIHREGACHLFRHAMATAMLDRGADIRFIQEMLGHESLESTQIYTHVSIQKLKEVHARTHPARLLEDDHVET